LKNSRGEVLALKAADGGSFEGYYDLPGGRIDTDEFATRLDSILAREVREELGEIKFIASSKPVALGRHQVVGGPRVIYLFFEGNYIDGDIKISNEHKGHQWFDLAKIELEKYFKSGILEGIKMYLGK
jgi:8-oxo-dGTP pyrophosphatase MutT (NUDIX family)